MRVLGLDIGLARIGIAISDPGAKVALPLTTIENNETVYDTIKNLCEEHSVGMIIYGLPIGKDGQIGSQAKIVNEFIERMHAVLGLPTTAIDERFSSKIAKQAIPLKKRQGWRESHAVIDSAAAAIILQTYLDQLRNMNKEQ